MDFFLRSAFKDKVHGKNHTKQNQLQKQVEMVYEDLDEDVRLCETKQKTGTLYTAPKLYFNSVLATKLTLFKCIKKIMLPLYFQLKLFVHSHDYKLL
jgi:hypothetical protein